MLLDPVLLQLIVAGGLTLLGIVVTALIWKRAKVRTVVWWLGLSLVPISIYLLGLAPQVIGAYETLRLWYGTLTLTPVVWVGVALFGLGLLLMIVSRLLPDRPRHKPAPAASSAPSRPAAPAYPAAPATQTRPLPAHQSTPSDADLDEVTEILRRRGIQ